MKTNRILLLTLVFVLSMATVAFAAYSNPFDDVPANHWAYESVVKLAKDGIIDGYGDGTFRGDRVMTRYEMAHLVARAVSRSAQANPENKALIDKLSIEFADELKSLGVRVAALEQKQYQMESKLSNLRITGELRPEIRNWTYTTSGGSKYSINLNNFRTRLGLWGQINDGWQYKAGLENEQNVRVSGEDGDNKVYYAFVEGPIGGATVKLGRTTWFAPVFGMVEDNYIDGIQVSFGKELQVQLAYGREEKGAVDGKTIVFHQNGMGAKQDVNYTGVALSYPLDDKTNIKAAYHDYQQVRGDANNKLWEVGFDNQLDTDWYLYASYAKSNADTQNKGYMVGVNFKKFDHYKPNSYRLFAEYRNLEAYSVWRPTQDNFDMTQYFWDGSAWQLKYAGWKGTRVGFNYVIDKFIIWTTEYSVAKTTRLNETTEKYLTTYVNFYF